LLNVGVHGAGEKANVCFIATCLDESMLVMGCWTPESISCCKRYKDAAW
jgi:hypothetical protein